MQLATGGNMLNFGYWKETTKNPKEAQHELCMLIAKLAELDSAKKVIDVGSGFSAPAIYWNSIYELQISCVNVNFHQLQSSTSVDVNESANSNKPSLLYGTNDVSLVNATSAALPFADHCVDRIIALESAQHFRPLTSFVQESKRVLKRDGLLVLAVPVANAKSLASFMKLGILSLTWSSEHYSLESLKSAVTKAGFQIDAIQQVGPQVYSPLTNYYVQNRPTLRQRIVRQYPSYLENILYKSLLKMKDVSQKGIIDYVLIKCSVP